MSELDKCEESLRLSNHLCFSVYAASHAFNRTYKSLLDRLGITYPQYLTLLVLWEQDNLTVNEIAAHLGLDSGTVTPILKRLEGLGHLERRRDAADERQVRITLTENGKRLRHSALAIPSAINERTGLDASDRAALRQSVLRLWRKLEPVP